MGYDATNFVPNNISKEKLFNLIDLLGFKGNGKLFFFYKEDNYKYLYGVGLRIEKAKNGFATLELPFIVRSMI